MKSPIQKIGVVGANRFSVPLVQWVLEKGYPVVWMEHDFSSLETHLADFRNGLETSLHSGKITHLMKDGIMGLLSGTTQFADLIGCNLVMEMTPDDLEEKRNVALQLETLLSPDAWIGVSLETLTVSQLASYLRRPSRLFGIRPIGLPPRTLEGLEILAGMKTSPDAVQAASDFALMLELYPAIAREGPGGIANRLLVRGFCEALDLSGGDFHLISRLDTELTRRGWETLPGVTMEKIGERNVHRLLSFFHRFYGKTFSGGRETDERFQTGFPVRKGGGGPSGRNISDMADQWVLALLNESVQIVSEGISPWETVDQISRLTFGLRWEKGGLLQWGNQRGWSVILTGIWSLSAQTEGRIWPSALLQLKGVSERNIPDEYPFSIRKGEE
ncbi:MAG: 3-hydroxyacyl-CoA dehydrogenase NAD-binding domain-containing protein [Leptospirales bacterium]